MSKCEQNIRLEDREEKGRINHAVCTQIREQKVLICFQRGAKNNESAMFKKILSASLVLLQMLTQSAGAAEFRPIIQPVAVQPLQFSSDILENKNPSSGVTFFCFLKYQKVSLTNPWPKAKG